MPSGSTALVRVDEFGPFDVLAEWAHRAYVEGRCEAAVRACRDAVLVVEAAGDVQTTRFLRYVEGFALLELGRRREAITCAMDLLSLLGEDADPLWRAKALALLAEASAGAGELKRAMEALAEGTWLISRQCPGSYNHMSASMAVSIALRSVYLFEQSEELLASCVVEGLPGADLQVADEEAKLLVTWAMVLDLIGHREQSQARFVRTAEAAARMRTLAAQEGDAELVARAEVLLAYAESSLGEHELAAARVRPVAESFRRGPEVLESSLLDLVLGRDAAARGDFGGARKHFYAAGTAAEEVGRDVGSATAMAHLGETDVAEYGRHPAVGIWKRLFRESLQRTWLEREERFAALADRNRLRDLAEEHRRVGQESLSDPLTGLGNRRMMSDRVSQDHGLLSVVFLDVDCFKQVNDRFSHAVGDQVLQRMAELLRQNCRPEDDVVRYGGDEFVVLVHGEDGAAAAEDIARRLHLAVRSTDWGRIAAGLTVTASIGVASAADAEVALSTADAALFSAKRFGRDRVVAG